MKQTAETSKTVERLRGAGLRPTRQRVALADLLFKNGEDHHVTAESLHEEALSTGARVSLATVYNTLHQFTHAGLLREISVDSGKTYFDTNISDHHHFYDEAGSLLIDIPADRLPLDSLPHTPEGTEVDRIDVVIRLKRRS
ncbi:MAG: Fur family transcriptional regulator [Alphaproteobacteria bacterium]|nr:Fur family transcriptional regulator [Alphaproteobacteria bacterium]